MCEKKYKNMSSIRRVSSWSKETNIGYWQYTLRIHWRLPFGRKINKYGVLLSEYINLMENTRLPFGLKIINMGCKK